MRRAIVIAALAASACAGRDPKPVAVYQPTDAVLSCQQLSAEIAANQVKIAQTQEERDANRGRNVAIGIVGGLLFWPALFALDTGNHEEVEMNALSQRNDGLMKQMAVEKCAPEPPVTAVSIEAPL